MKNPFTVHIKIQKPVAEVFDAVVNPKKLTGYFVGSASAPLVEGTTVMWSFVEHPGEFPVEVRTIVPNERIVLEWNGADSSYLTQVEMTFKPVDDGSTVVGISESGWRDDENGVNSSYRNCGGWMHMACCMKAYLDHGINLRKGSVHLDPAQP